jgi:hypothetical protein
MKNRAAVSTTRKYFQQLHLTNVVECYEEATRRLIAPSIGWYVFKVPRINIDIVRRDLLSTQEIAEHLGVHEISLREQLKKSNVPCYFVENRELVRRTELDRLLSQSSVNGFREYPT